MTSPAPTVIDRADFNALFSALERRGFAVIGPTVRDQVIVYDQLRSDADLPVGWTDEQEAGRYRLKRRNDGALFAYAVGLKSWKHFLHPERLKLMESTRDAGGAIHFSPGDQEAPSKLAFLGVRACELRAIGIQDRVFLGGSAAIDPHYAKRRREIATIAVNCGTAGGTCFCVSMKTGPKVDRAQTAYDLELTEMIDDHGHRFLISPGSALGADILSELPGRPAAAADIRQAEAVTAKAAAEMGRKLDTEQLPEVLLQNLEHPRWDEVAQRCLTCANCTMVCPTCFCTTVEDVTDITGDHAERWRRWDSCFTLDFSWMHGGSARQTGRSRYRQWLTHKLATWHQQFGSSGCVGCGRCITWCPVGIDLTEEAAALRTPAAGLTSPLEP